MGELSEQTLRLREWHVAPGGKLVINLTQPPREEDLPRLHDAVNAFVGSLAARSEAQPSGYDGGKSLGERFYEGLVSATSYAMEPWRNVPDMLKSRYEIAALTFTASLSGGEGEGEARPEPARERRGDPCPAQPANTDDTGKEG